MYENWNKNLVCRLNNRLELAEKIELTHTNTSRKKYCEKINKTSKTYVKISSRNICITRILRKEEK